MKITGDGNITISGVINSNINIGNMSKGDFNNWVNNCIETANLKLLFEKCWDLNPNQNDSEMRLQSAAWHGNEKQKRIGIISDTFYREQLAKINYALTELYPKTNDYKPFVQETYQQTEMNKYQNLSKSDVANVLLTYLKDINPTNRPFIAVLQNEVLLAQKELQYSKLQSQLEQLASASVSPNVNNFHDAVFKSNYDGWVKSTIEILIKYIEIIDKHSTNNELPSAALSRLSNTKTMENLKLWIDSLKRATGSRVKLSDKLVDKLDYWRKYVEGLDELEVEIVLDNQIIPDFKLYCNQNEI